jgi:hypothetical protein
MRITLVIKFLLVFLLREGSTDLLAWLTTPSNHCEAPWSILSSSKRLWIHIFKRFGNRYLMRNLSDFYQDIDLLFFIKFT